VLSSRFPPPGVPIFVCHSAFTSHSWPAEFDICFWLRGEDLGALLRRCNCTGVWGFLVGGWMWLSSLAEYGLVSGLISICLLPTHASPHSLLSLLQLLSTPAFILRTTSNALIYCLQLNCFASLSKVTFFHFAACFQFNTRRDAVASISG
jgi:hypothetical protein